jgi:LemA protein
VRPRRELHQEQARWLGFSRLADALTFRDIEFESEEFNRRFTVKGADERFATAFCDARMMDWLLRHGDGYAFEVVGDRLLCWCRRVAPARMIHLLRHSEVLPGADPGRRELSLPEGVGFRFGPSERKGANVEVLWVVLAVVVVLAIAGVVSYNRFVSQKNLIKDAWANIDTELRRRYDLIPNIVETVKGYAAHEREVFENVTRARANATGATGSPAEQAAAEGPLVAALRQLFAVVENYPDLKANQNFLALQAELTNTEDRLQTARRFYNANVRDYNQRVQSVPSNVVANLFHFEEEEFFEVEEALRGDEGVPRVSFEAGAPGVSFGSPSEPSTAPPATPPAGMPPTAEPPSVAPGRPDEPAG